MSFKWLAFCLIVVSLVCAGTMIASGVWFADRGVSQVVSGLVIALWWIPFSYFGLRVSSHRQCRRCTQGSKSRENVPKETV
jgi:hypothetical protein